MDHDPFVRKACEQGVEFWQYRAPPFNTWRGKYPTEKEAEEAHALYVAKNAEELEKLRMAHIRQNAEHLNAVLGKAIELNPELWQGLKSDKDPWHDLLLTEFRRLLRVFLSEEEVTQAISALGTDDYGVIVLGRLRHLLVSAS